MYTIEELLSIAENHNINEKYHDKFVVFTLKEISIMVADNDLEEDSINDWAVKNSIHYINLYDEELKKGHSEEWAEIYAASFIENDGVAVLGNTYNTIKKISSQKAKDELIIHCKALGEDNLYTKHFISLMEMGEWHSDPDKQASIYSRVYKEQIENQKSETFAHKYADLIAMGEYSVLYCLSEANEYEKALIEGYSDDFASIYSVKIAEYICNNFSNYDEALESVLYKFEKEKIETKYSRLKSKA